MAERDTEREIIHGYLRSLSKYLSRLEKADADDVIREIESHIYDVLEVREREGREVDAEAILAGFGDPRALAAEYVNHILEGTPPPRGFRAIQVAKAGASRGLYYSMGLFGYGVALLMVILGIAKTFEPDRVGVWMAESGEALVVGARSYVPAGPEEMLGWWLVPIAIGLGVCAAYLTRRVLAVLRERL